MAFARSSGASSASNCFGKSPGQKATVFSSFSQLLILAGALTCVIHAAEAARAETLGTAIAPLSAKLPDGRQRAFPTAEGYGAAARGGRGGVAIYVTNTNESGEGSLRSCVEASGARTCIFRTGGTITLNEASLVIRNPFVTIAGETAPGGGIAIRNGAKQKRPSVEIHTNDVVIRHIRIRPGPHAVESCCSGALGLYSKAATDIMLDHISASWGSDETVDSEDATNFTWQWGITSEPLLNGGPGKKDRARNMLFTKGGNVSVHHSLFATGQFRNPQIKMKEPNAIADVVNNVLYSPAWQYVISFGDEWTRTQANVVGNFKIAGDNLKNDRLVQIFEESGNGAAVYVNDNFDETYIASGQDDREALIESHRQYIVSERFDAPPVGTTSPQTAYDEVLAYAGANKPARDSVDERVVEDVKTRSGRLLKNDPEKVGGWPELAKGGPYPDVDRDGMANDWESENGLNPDDGADASLDSDGDGWTNLEEFLHFMAGDPRGN